MQNLWFQGLNYDIVGSNPKYGSSWARGGGDQQKNHDWTFFPDSRVLLPIFRTNCPHGSHFAQMGSYFAQDTITNPCSLLSTHKPQQGMCTCTKHPQPCPLRPLFLSWIRKCAKWTTVWAKCTPTGQNVWKVGNFFLFISKTLSGTFAQRLCNSYNYTNAPCQHKWPSPGPWPNSKCTKTVEVWCL